MEVSDDIVQISDEDSPRPSCVSLATEKLDDLETIIIDDDFLFLQNDQNHAMHPHEALFKKLIKQCVDVGLSKSFLKVVSKHLIKAYQKADKEYLKSKEFEKEVKKAADFLKEKPWAKFSVVKSLCDTLMKHSQKKRVKLQKISSSTSISGKHNKDCLKRKGSVILTDARKKMKPDVVICIDDDDEEDEGQIEISDDDMQAIDITKDEAEKENLADECRKNDESQSDVHSSHLEEEVEIEWNPNQSVTCSSPILIEVPKVVDPKPPDTTKIITAIEKKILYYKQRISELEEQEVVEDSVNSPYILAEKYKQRVVNLYEQLCDLKGAEATKRREVRLKVLNGHPAGPVIRLEKYINRNIGRDGVPAFPDFTDVVKCVEEAVTEDNTMAGWTKAMILQEASALFTQCGEALQKQRKKREWRHLLTRVDLNSVECDPADKDPALRAKLDANKKLALQKENELLQKYVTLQNHQNMFANQVVQTSSSTLIEISSDQAIPSSSANNITVENDDKSNSGDETDSDENNDDKPIQIKLTESEYIDLNTKPNITEQSEQTEKNEDNLQQFTAVDDGRKSSKLITIEEDSVMVLEESKDKVIECHNTNNKGDEAIKCVVKNSVDPETNRSVDDKVLQSSEDSINNDGSSAKNNDALESNTVEVTNDENSVVNIKKEKVDVVSLLTELGDNFTASIVDIIDPFLVIDISSDSSDEEDL